ncbi:uncharacterized protein LOC119109077 [Pollicipes pollicipes]|uniref:uncharacterized protein LOC119109077 n=1 Tax=Pollicipes pollicipes TaxID=41117 RepID=UPI001884CEFE|nr:uncharacterized protein LOC119109077 [Pollicipes pollicipes]
MDIHALPETGHDSEVLPENNVEEHDEPFDNHRAQAHPEDPALSPGLTKRSPTIEDNPSLRVPFNRGWRREVVQRACTDEQRPGQIRADAYYFSPRGKKLRSIKEVDAYLKKTGSSLALGCFSFSRHLLGVGRPLEQLRKARPVVPTGSPHPAGEKAAAPAGKVPRKNHTITIGSASSVIKIPSAPASHPTKAPRKHSLMEKSRKAFVWKAMELKKKLPVFQPDMSKAKPAPTERSQPAASAASSGSDPHRVLVRRPWQLAEVDERGQVSCRQPPDGPTTVEYFRLVRATAAPHSADNVQIGQRRPPTPCSLFCFSAEGEARPALPSVQCLVCRCLSHASCVGLDDDDRLFSFVCVDCYLGVQRMPVVPKKRSWKDPE